MSKWFIFFLVWLTPSGTLSQSRTHEYIDAVRELAVRQSRQHHIPVAIILAQAVIESGSGTSYLARVANNHFGVKCSSGWSGARVRKTDDKPGECFRKYATIGESFNDHSLILTTRARYSHLFELDPTDLDGWARGLQKSGYATSPRYASDLMKCIRRYSLDTILVN